MSREKATNPKYLLTQGVVNPNWVPGTGCGTTATKTLRKSFETRGNGAVAQGMAAPGRWLAGRGHKNNKYNINGSDLSSAATFRRGPGGPGGERFRMLGQHRLDEIMARLEQDGQVRVTELSAILKVTDETIRRDLKLLEGEGRLRRIHGGAVVPRRNEEQPVDVRSRLNPREKQRIATLALGLLREGMSIFIDTGTTANALAQRVAEWRGLNVITNSLDVALTVARQGSNRVMIAPGTVRAKDNAVIGADAIRWAGTFYYDIAFMGIGAVNLTQGFMDYEEEEAQLRRVLVGRTERSVILADESKFGRRAFVRTLDFAAVTTLVTNEPLSADYAAAFREARTDVVC